MSGPTPKAGQVCMASAAGNVRHGVTSIRRGVGQSGQGTRAGGLNPVRACLSAHFLTASRAATGDVQLALSWDCSHASSCASPDA